MLPRPLYSWFAWFVHTAKTWARGVLLRDGVRIRGEISAISRNRATSNSWGEENAFGSARGQV